MKFHSTFSILITGVFLAHFISGHSQTTFQVTAKNGLNIREKPNLESSKICNVPFNSLLDAIEFTGKFDKIIDYQLEIKGECIKVLIPYNSIPESKEFAGYVFNGYLNAIDDQRLFTLRSDTLDSSNLLTDLGNTEHYEFLKKHYALLAPQEEIEVYSWSDQKCAFTQRLEHEIKYSFWRCKEAGGILETMSFPRMAYNNVKKFITEQFIHPDNIWVSEIHFEPKKGVGCYYEIRQTNDKTVIDIYCGC